MSQPGWLGSLRVAGLYMAGVTLGALGASTVQPEKYMVGASAGVYALIAAHLGKKIACTLLWFPPVFVTPHNSCAYFRAAPTTGSVNKDFRHFYHVFFVYFISATLILNWKEDGQIYNKRLNDADGSPPMSLNPYIRGFRLAFVVLFAAVDIGFALYKVRPRGWQQQWQYSDF